VGDREKDAQLIQGERGRRHGGPVEKRRGENPAPLFFYQTTAQA
jgi:hypothetical protein